jgi:hypothetical protein
MPVRVKKTRQDKDRQSRMGLPEARMDFDTLPFASTIRRD